MKKLILFIDGAVYTSLLSTAPFIFPAYTVSPNGINNAYRINNRQYPFPLSKYEAHYMTGTRLSLLNFHNNINSTHIISDDGWKNVIPIASTTLLGPYSESQRERVEVNIVDTVYNMVWLLVFYVVGKSLGCYIMMNNRRQRLTLLLYRIPIISRILRNVVPWRIVCTVIAILACLLLQTWGAGLGIIKALHGYMALRFTMAFLSGGLLSWNSSIGNNNNNNNNDQTKQEYENRKESDIREAAQRHIITSNMEEGQSLLSSSPSSFATNEEEDDKRPNSNSSNLSSSSSSSSSAQEIEKKWYILNWYWLVGAASSSLISGYVFYPVNRLIFWVVEEESQQMYNKESQQLCALLVLIGIGGFIDRCLFRYYWKKNRPITAMSNNARGSSLSTLPSKLKTASYDSHDRCSMSMGLNQSSTTTSTTTLSRRKQSRQSSQQQRLFTHDDDDEEQQVTLLSDAHVHHQQQPAHHNRQRLNSNDTLDTSEEFFDCLDDIELDSDHLYQQQHHDDIETAITPRAELSPSSNDTTVPQNHENQIAIYSNRRIIYPTDGSSAYVPSGETLSTIPPCYLQLYHNDHTKAQQHYKQTQDWRASKSIHAIHSQPHTWFTKIKQAYPHVVHGFTKDGMPVVYESPGRMNLKELFRNGCAVDDMIFHYCYLMEYLSNLESILTELHSSHSSMGGGGDDNDDWQEELAAYAHAKQVRLQTDPITFGFCVVMDVSGASPKSLSGDVMIYLKRAGETNSSHYPGSMRRSIAVQAPIWIGVAWKVMRGTMPASAKVDLLNGKQTMEGGLKAYIDEDQIPVEYGGTSKFKLGEHPFEVGLRQLVERQGEESTVTVASSSLGGYQPSPSPPIYTPSSPPRAVPQCRDGGNLLLQRGNNSTEDSKSDEGHIDSTTMAREWGGLSNESILTVVSILQFFLYVIIGSLELALPYWLITPPTRGGMGYETQDSGLAVFCSCIFIAYMNKRSRFIKLARCTNDKSPLRGFRIGIGSTCFFLICISLIQCVTPYWNSTLVLVCLSVHLSIIFLSIILGMISLDYIRDVIGSCVDGRGSSKASIIGRILGYMVVAPIFRWSVMSELSYPLNASLPLCLLAGICWLLYIISFSLHTTGPSSSTASTRRQKESEFMSAMSSCVKFGKEIWIVASTDIAFLTSKLLLKETVHRV